MTSKKLLLAGLIAALGLAGTSQAAVVSVKPKLAAVLNADFTPADPSSYVSDAGGVTLQPNGAKYVLQYDFLMTIGDLQAGQLGFGNAAVNINLVGGTQSPDFPGWTADGFQVDSNGARPGGVVAKWAGNQDGGQDSSDLQNILIETAPKTFFTGVPPGTDNTTDPRRTLGVAPYNNTNSDPLGNPITPHEDGEYAGTVFVEVAGIAGTQGSVAALATGGSVYNDLLELTTAGTTGAGGSASFAVVPEPSTLALLGLGSALLVFARKRR